MYYHDLHSFCFNLSALFNFSHTQYKCIYNRNICICKYIFKDKKSWKNTHFVNQGCKHQIDEKLMYISYGLLIGILSDEYIWTTSMSLSSAPSNKIIFNSRVFYLLLSTDVWLLFLGIPEVFMPRLRMFKKQISNASDYLIMFNFIIKCISRCLVNIDDSDMTFYKQRKRSSIVDLLCSWCGGELEVLLVCLAIFNYQSISWLANRGTGWEH